MSDESMNRRAIPESTDRKDFIREIIARDLEEGRYDNVRTRFPPEPNGYPHIGHAKAIVLNFELAREFDGRCHLRFDDTNPEDESQEYVDAIREAVEWLGYDPGEHVYFASDYFEQFYEYALRLIRNGDAYVDSLNEEQISEYRGSIDEPGKESPYRDRGIEENLALFRDMKEGKYDEGEHVLRARIDMSADHLLMRDPLLYRIRHRNHYRRGEEWCIYPMYDFAHALEDAIEHITHSLCTLEFEQNRILYDWVIEHCLTEEEKKQRPFQYEFARFNLEYTVMSKTKMGRLIDEGYVEDWSDPRLPSLSGLRRRGVPPSSVRLFMRDIGITRTPSRVEIDRLENTIRKDLEDKAPRVLAVQDPLQVTVTNFPEEQTEWLDAPYWPENIPRDQTRPIPFTRTLFIDRDDFQEDPDPDFYRLAPGREVRLRHGYFLTCHEVNRNENGEIESLFCTYDPETRGGVAPDGRSPSGTIHWVSADHAITAEIRAYDRLFDVPDPDRREGDFTEYVNPSSLVVKEGYIEPGVAEDPEDQRYQFERLGYFRRDPEDSKPGHPVFNKIVSLYNRETPDDKNIEEERKRKKEKKKEHRKRSIEGQKDPVELLDEAGQKRYQSYTEDLDLDRHPAAIIAEDEEVAAFFENTCDRVDCPPEEIARHTVHDLMRVLKKKTLDDLPFGPREFGRWIQLIWEDRMTEKAGDEIFEEMVRSGTDPVEMMKTRDLEQVEDREKLSNIVAGVLDDHPEQVEEYRQGNEEVIHFLMGQVMKQTEGRADPEETLSLLEEQLE